MYNTRKEISVFTIFEFASFFGFVFVKEPVFMMWSRLPFVLGVPVYAMGLAIFLFIAIVSKGAAMLTCAIFLLVAGLFPFVLFYVKCKELMERFSRQLLHEWLLERVKHLLKEQHQQSMVFVLEQAKEKSLVFGQLAHDIGTPLAALSMAIELLERQSSHPSRKSERSEGNNSELDEAFDAMNAAVSSITVLRQSMLDYVKKANGAMLKPNLDLVDLKRLVSKKAFLILRQLLANNKTVKALWYVQPQLVHRKVFSAESWLLDMLLNYISNAVKFTKEGYIKLNARLDETENGKQDNVVFEVQDSGTGISIEKASELFCPFNQLQDNKGGTGLGLFAVKQKAEILGGRAGFYNNQDKPGCTFFFTIPISKVHRGCSSTDKPPRVATSSSCQLNTDTSMATGPSLRPLAPEKIHRTSSKSTNKCPSVGSAEQKASRSSLSLFQTHQGGSGKISARSASSDILLQQSIEGLQDSLEIEGKRMRTLQHSQDYEDYEPSYEDENAMGHSLSVLKEEPESIRTSRPSQLQFEWSGYEKYSARTIRKVSPKPEEWRQTQRTFRVPEEDTNKLLTTIDFSRLRVMIVDDSPILLKLYDRMLKELNVKEVIWAASGEECYDALFGPDAKPVQVIIMDDQMPGSRGPDVAKDIAAQYASTGVEGPAVFICTGNLPEMIQDSFPDIYEYVKDILLKPISLNCLKRILSSNYLDSYESFALASVKQERKSSYGFQFQDSVRSSNSRPVFDVNATSLLTAQFQLDRLNKGSYSLQRSTKIKKRKKSEGDGVSPFLIPNAKVAAAVFEKDYFQMTI